MHLGNFDNLIKTTLITLSTDGDLKAEAGFGVQRMCEAQKLLVFIIILVLHEETESQPTQLIGALLNMV